MVPPEYLRCILYANLFVVHDELRREINRRVEMICNQIRREYGSSTDLENIIIEYHNSTCIQIFNIAKGVSRAGIAQIIDEIYAHADCCTIKAAEKYQEFQKYLLQSYQRFCSNVLWHEHLHHLRKEIEMVST